jgi:hypothetical protein
MRTLIALFLGLSTSAVWAGSVKPASVGASSTLPTTQGVNYGPQNVMDGKQSTVWCEGDESGSGLGTTLTLELGSEQEITGLKIWNGNWYSQDFWTRHNRINNLEIAFSDGSKESFSLKNERVAEVITFKSKKRTSSLRLRIRSVHQGTTFDDTVISELRVLNEEPESQLKVANWSDSSHLPADTDGTYEPPNLWDGILDSMWCEGVEGDGNGEWVEFDFGRARSISKLNLVNGNAYNLMWWMKSNRMLSAQLEFSNGSSQEIAVKNSIRKQTIAFDPVTASKVRMRVTSVKQGNMAKKDAAFDCVCLSEATFGK